MKLLKQFIQQETVLTAAAVLAVVSAFFVPPDVQYLGYIDLFCRMRSISATSTCARWRFCFP